MSKKKWPALPGSIVAAGGPVTVLALPEADMKGFMGTFWTHSRKIQIANDLKKDAAWLTLFHEQVEAYIHDAGLHNIIRTKKQLAMKEAICDAVALGMLAQFKHDRGL